MATDLGIRTRLESIADLEAKYTFLDTSIVRELANIAIAMLHQQNRTDSQQQSNRRQLDLSEMDPDQIKQFLLSLSIPPDESVQVVWCSTSTGAVLTFRELVDHYDDLWYPSSDDIWVLPYSMSWLLEFNHEEILTFLHLADKQTS